MTDQKTKNRSDKTNLRLKEEKMQEMKGDGMKSMREMSAHVSRHHLKPLPESQPEVNPFPAPLLRSVGWGAVAGLLIGLVWAALLRNMIIVVPGWEGLYSMTPFTFLVFWGGIGAALGGFVAGLAAIFLTPAEPLHRDSDGQEEHQQHQDGG